jgi:hypothetical protein
MKFESDLKIINYLKLKGLTQNPIKFAKILYNFYAKINFIFEEI